MNAWSPPDPRSSVSAGSPSVGGSPPFSTRPPNRRAVVWPWLLSGAGVAAAVVTWPLLTTTDSSQTRVPSASVGAPVPGPASVTAGPVLPTEPTRPSGSLPGQMGPGSVPTPPPTTAPDPPNPSTVPAPPATVAPEASSTSPPTVPSNDPIATASTDSAHAECRRHLVMAVHFAPDSWTMTDPDREAVRRAAAELPSSGPIYLDGYTDRRPISIGNRRLSQYRADAFADELRSLVADPERIVAIGHGSADPVDDGDGEAAYARNRRTVLSFDCPSASAPDPAG